MKIRKHFRLSNATIDYIITEFSFNRISNKDIYFEYCVNKRIQQLNSNYDAKIDRILSLIILNCDYDDMPLNCLAKITLSLSKVTTAISKGLINLI